MSTGPRNRLISFSWIEEATNQKSQLLHKFLIKMEEIKVKPTWDDITEGQSIALSICCRVSALMSIVGSSIVLHQILAPSRREAMLKTMYNRMILTISTMDVIGSLALFMSTWPIPKDTIHDDWIWGNIGNQTTCNIQGYFIQSSVLSVAFCTTFLCIYFMLLIKYNWSERRLRKMELMMRGTICLVFISSIIPLSTEAYNPTLVICWVQSYPIDCDTSDEYECLRGDHVVFLRNLFASGPIYICILIITITMSLLYISVREQEKSVSKYRRSQRSESSSSSRTRKVFIKAALFIGSFCFIWIPSLVGGALIKQRDVYNIFFPLWISIFVPLQGLFNAFIYNYEKLNGADMMRRVSYIFTPRLSSGRIFRSVVLNDISSENSLNDEESHESQQVNGSNARYQYSDNSSRLSRNQEISLESTLMESLPDSRTMSSEIMCRSVKINEISSENNLSDHEARDEKCTVMKLRRNSLRLSIDRSQCLESSLVELDLYQEEEYSE